LWLVLGVGVGRGNINVDETFDGDSAPFEDLHGTATLLSRVSLKGINVLATYPGFSSATMQYNATSALTPGSLFPIRSSGIPKCWKLEPGQEFKWGQAGPQAGGETDGLGIIADYGGGIDVMQVAVAVEPSAAARAAGTDLGQIKYFFWTNVYTTLTLCTTHTLEYKLVSAGAGVLDILEVRDGVVARTVKAGLPVDTWSQITTVMAGNSATPDNWADYPTTALSPYWDPWTGRYTVKQTKGWPTNTRLTSPTIFMAYTFVDAMPLGTPSTPAYLVDDPWRIDGLTGVDPLHPRTNKIRTIRYAAGPADPLYLENPYQEACIRSGESGVDVNEWIAVERSHKFNEPYPVPALHDPPGVELSAFRVH